jgi:hypothetical protein
VSLLPPSSRRRPSAAGGLLLAVLLAAASARAQDSDQSQGPSDPAPPPSGRSEATLQQRSPLGNLSIGGRLRARETLSAKEDKEFKGQLTLPAARLEFTYDWKGRVKAVVEFDVLDGLKDAYAALKVVDGLAVRVGRFKVPLSLVELESSARLPVVRRGLVHDVLKPGVLNLTHRQVGAQLEWQCLGCARVVRLRVGVWQPEEGRFSVEEGLGLMPMARGTWQVLDTLEVGASARGDAFSAVNGGVSAHWTLGVDVKHALPLSWGEWRSWAEVLVGRSPLLSASQGQLLTARLVTAVRYGGLKKNRFYVEPFLMASAVDPALRTTNDLLWEAVGGLNVGQWRRWRLQAQYEQREAEAAVPAVLTTLEEDLVKRKALLVQLEVMF